MTGARRRSNSTRVKLFCRPSISCREFESHPLRSYPLSHKVLLAILQIAPQIDPQSGGL